MEKIKFSTLYIAEFLAEKMQKAAMEEMLHKGLTGTKNSVTGIDPRSLLSRDKDLTAQTKLELVEFLTRMGANSGSNNYMSLSVSPVPIHQAPDLFPPGGVEMWG